MVIAPTLEAHIKPPHGRSILGERRAMLELLKGPQTFQTFKDTPDADVSPHVLHGGLMQHWHRLRDMNGAGAGIFFSVNETNQRGRTLADITRVRAYYAEIDQIPFEDQKRARVYGALSAALPPSAIVESKNGLHLYWYALKNQPLDPAEYKLTNLHLIHAFEGDKRVRDLARVLRVPGFKHTKDPEHPFAVMVTYEDPAALYDWREIREAYPLPQHEQPQPWSRSGKPSAPSPEAWEVVLQGLFDWRPVDGEKHFVLMLALGVAVKFGVPQAQAEEDLIAVVSGWNTRESAETSVRSRARWAYTQGGPCTVKGLRSAGVPVPKLPRPPSGDSRSEP